MPGCRCLATKRTAARWTTRWVPVCKWLPVLVVYRPRSGHIRPFTPYRFTRPAAGEGNPDWVMPDAAHAARVLRALWASNRLAA